MRKTLNLFWTEILKRSALTGRLACRLLAVDNFAAAARLARELSLIVLIHFGGARGALAGCAAKFSEIAAAARGCTLNCGRLADAALDAARKVGIVLGTMPTERAVLATRTEAAGATLCAGCRARVDRGVHANLTVRARSLRRGIRERVLGAVEAGGLSGEALMLSRWARQARGLASGRLAVALGAVAAPRSRGLVARAKSAIRTRRACLLL